ncbi:arginine--tRNA ligase [Flavobacterium album]|uniref:Arginine--tRNA ligase n=1 Tax=Flavobacterium album TaxID=2175091 RepID=A0A2S1QTK3_9FLAO|nr:arginine--tRNA ligase [Flavobacterium album]AWH83715.1 arginine--tRNA ligase [Flavobacterium album]
MALSQILVPHIQKAVEALFGISVEKIELQATRREFEGDITMVIFPLLKLVKSNPAALGNAIGQYLLDNTDVVEKFNVAGGGFLNLVISDAFYITFFNEIKEDENFGSQQPAEGGKAVMVEYASPNTNKPLHLGHVRNVLLGYSVANIIEASGKNIYKTQVINDRGIHICKSMLAYEKFGHGETPESEGVKGDKLVGNYYVRFEKELQKEVKPFLQKFWEGDFSGFPEVESAVTPLKEEITKLKGIYEEKKSGFELPEGINVVIQGYYNTSKNDVSYRTMIKDLRDEEYDEISDKDKVAFENAVKPLTTLESKIDDKEGELKEIAKKLTAILKEARQMLLKWEAGDEAVVALWKKMNGWVYEGFELSFKNIGVDFDKNYYESDTYLLGKDVVADGLDKGVFYKKEDGSVWIDLTDEGLDEKLVLRRDGTSVYITQDIGTAIQRVKDFPDVGGMVYTVGNEQDYHFKVLFLILKKLGFDWAENLYHLSYGMVDLPSGKMKSREGTVVDADDLMEEMVATAKSIADEMGKLEGCSDEEKAELYKTIGLGALKYQMLKVDPKKRILFDPKESIDFNGDSGPFIQMSYVRTRAILRKAEFDITETVSHIALHPKEKELIKLLETFPAVVQNAASQYSPALIAGYAYDLAKEFSSYYQVVSILGEEDESLKVFKVQLSKKVGETLKSAFGLLGIGMPERM